MKYSDEITQEICKYLRAGNTQHDSAVLAGISEETFYTWKKEKSEFSEALKKAEQECKSRNIAIIQRAAEKTWQAAAWWLERKHNSEFALKQVNELVGKNGEQLSILVKLDMAGGYIPQLGATIATPTTSNQRPAQVQSASVAQESEKDDNGGNGDSQAGAL